MKYFALFALFYSLKTFTSAMPAQNKTNAPFNVYVKNDSNATIFYWFSDYNNPSFSSPQSFSIQPKYEVNIRTLPGANLTLFRDLENKKECLADLILTPERKVILITSQSSVQYLQFNR
jgi:hypothetical protein